MGGFFWSCKSLSTCLAHFNSSSSDCPVKHLFHEIYEMISFFNRWEHFPRKPVKISPYSFFLLFFNIVVNKLLWHRTFFLLVFF